jgi:hypothetical protein
MKVDAKTEAKVEAHAVADLTMKAGDCRKGYQMNRKKKEAAKVEFEATCIWSLRMRSMTL